MTTRADRMERIEKIDSEHEERVRNELARMKAEGIEPSPEKGRFGYGLYFWVEVTPLPDGKVDFRLSTYDHANQERSPDDEVRIGGIHPRPGLIIEGDDLLKAITKVWPSLAAPYLGRKDWPERFEMTVGSDVVTFENREGDLFVGVDGRFVPQNYQGVMAVEAIRAVADHMCRRRLASYNVRLDWWDVSSDTDLPPATIDGSIALGFDQDADRITHEAATNWFAMRHGQTSEEWVGRATWLEAREIVAFAEGDPKPTADDDWHPDANGFQGDDALISRACRIRHCTIDELRRHATEYRNDIARGIDVWGRERLRREHAEA